MYSLVECDQVLFTLHRFYSDQLQCVHQTFTGLGGNITINSDTIIASQGSLQTGGTLVAYDPDSDQKF